MDTFENQDSSVGYNNNTNTLLVKDAIGDKIVPPKPIVKWVGGKTQLIDKLLPNFPTEMNNYHEPFVGGGSVLIALLTYVKHGIIHVRGNIHAYDLNASLIYMYKNIQSKPRDVYDAVCNIINEFDQCGDGELNRNPSNLEEAMATKENYYYWTRRRYNTLCLTDNTCVLCSAMFIFLNKTCFRGVYRVGPSGLNVPYGHYPKPEIINKNHLETISELIQNVVFVYCDFNTSLSKIEPVDFVYIDPPYAPKTNTSFVGYTLNGFKHEDHISLFIRIHVLSDSNIKIMLCNSDVSLVRETFTDEKYNITEVLCKRAINSKNPAAKAKEVIIKNY